METLSAKKKKKKEFCVFIITNQQKSGNENLKKKIKFFGNYGMLKVALFDIFTLLFYLIYLYLEIYISILSEFITFVYFSICIQHPFISIA